VPTEFNFFRIKFRSIDIVSQFKDLLIPNPVTDSIKSKSNDSLKVENLCIDSLFALTFKVNLDSILEQEKNDLRITSFGDNKVLFSRFFSSLKSARDSSSNARIAYFGDSMIEGDLISQSLRNDLQNKMGGRGVGFVPITSMVSEFRKSIKHKFSDDWKEYSIQKSRELKNFALSGYVFNPKLLSKAELRDTLSKQDVSYVQYSAPDNSFPRLNNFYSTKLYYGKAPTGTFIKYYIDGKPQKIFLTGNAVVNELVLNKSNPYNDLKIEFYTDSIFDVYGVSFDSPKGVFIDNYAVRGNLGMALQKIPEEVLAGFNSYMNYSLLVFQFGLNVASPEARSFIWYENAMVNVVEYYKRIIPNADILIVSIGDKSHKYNMEYVTQPGIPKLIEAQRNIAKRTQSSFWNLYMSMGGYNSMKTWVESPHPLASKDYAHINFGGAEKISKMLSANIFNEFELYEFTLLKDQEKEKLLESILKSNSMLVDNFMTFDKQCAYVFDTLQKKDSEIDTIETSLALQTSEIQVDTVIALTEKGNDDSYEFRVQVAASKVERDIHEFDFLLNKTKDKVLKTVKGSDGFFRYYIAPYPSFDLAQAFADSIYIDVNDAFVVGFINDKFAKIEKVKQKQKEIEEIRKNRLVVNKTDVLYKDSLPQKNQNLNFINGKKHKTFKVLTFKDIYNKSFVEIDTSTNYVFTSHTCINNINVEKQVEMPVFRVQFCASDIELDKAFYQNVVDYFGDSLIIISKDNDGMIRYMLGDYKTYREAKQALKKVFDLKQDGYILAFQNNKRIKTEKAISIINKNKK